MSEYNESQNALLRLQAALERIASHAAAVHEPQLPPPEPGPDPKLGEVAERLDAVIARLRDALAED